MSLERAISPPSSPSLSPSLGVLRWTAGTLVILYGFSKVTGSQFTTLDSELTRPMGAVSGFWLTWHYFGYSTAFKGVIAAVEIVGGALLIIPRTALIGALILLPALLNIVLIDVLFGVDAGATVMAAIILACVLGVLAPHARRLAAFLVLDRAPVGGVRLCVLALVLVGAAGLQRLIDTQVTTAPTTLDGVWAVETAGGTGAPPTDLVFFERNRAFMAVFRTTGRRDLVRHFEIDHSGVVRIWEQWLRKGSLLMQGRVNARGGLELRSVSNEAERLELHRIDLQRLLPER